MDFMVTLANIQEVPSTFTSTISTLKVNKAVKKIQGLRANIEQKHTKTRHTIAFPCQFLNKYENRYSANELELLAVVWATIIFKSYLHGQKLHSKGIIKTSYLLLKITGETEHTNAV